MDIQNIYNSIAELSREIVRECTARSVKISTAESCTGGSAEHPVGEVCIAVSGRNGCRSERFLFAQGSADRELIRALAAEKALSMLLCEIKK